MKEIYSPSSFQTSTKNHPHYRPKSDIDPMYNDVNCGNGPGNDYGDEDVDQCPGRVDMGRGGCSINGPQLTLIK